MPKITIIHVEDDEMNRLTIGSGINAMGQWLKNHGFTFEFKQFSNVGSAIEAIIAYKPSAQEKCILITDQSIPDPDLSDNTPQSSDIILTFHKFLKEFIAKIPAEYPNWQANKSAFNELKNFIDIRLGNSTFAFLRRPKPITNLRELLADFAKVKPNNEEYKRGHLLQAFAKWIFAQKFASPDQYTAFSFTSEDNVKELKLLRQDLGFTQEILKKPIGDHVEFAKAISSGANLDKNLLEELNSPDFSFDDREEDASTASSLALEEDFNHAADAMPAKPDTLVPGSIGNPT